MRLLTRLALALALAACFPVFAASPRPDPAKLAEIPKRLAPFIESNVIAGAVTLVAHRGERWRR
jgi:hypothetical protein